MSAPLFSADDYLAAFLALMPSGPVWPRDSESAQVQALKGLTKVYERSNGRANYLLEDAFPGKTLELISEWETTLGLPDECSGPTPTIGERRALIVARLIGTGGQSIAYYTQLAAALGYEITITNFREHTVDADVDYPLYGNAWNHAWRVNGEINVIRYHTVDDSADDPLATWGDAALECAINLVKPEHTIVLFAYT